MGQARYVLITAGAAQKLECGAGAPAKRAGANAASPFGRPGGAPLPRVRVPKPAGRSRPPGTAGTAQIWRIFALPRLLQLAAVRQQPAPTVSAQGQLCRCLCNDRVRQRVLALCLLPISAPCVPATGSPRVSGQVPGFEGQRTGKRSAERR
ncbi:hypothetical protein VTN96DRAFT_4646 [Rasamsonia emersonii]